MTLRTLAASALFLIAAPAASFAQSATPTPPPPQDGTPTPAPATTAAPSPAAGGAVRGPGEGWYKPGSAPRDRRHRWDRDEDGYRYDDTVDPNQDAIFYFPTGRTLRRGQLSLGFPGAAGAPDIEYGLTNFLQIGAGYTLFGFTPQARLGLIRGRRVDFTLFGGAYLPAGTTHPFYGQYGGGVLSAGRDEFRVHLGYTWGQGWGAPFPDVDSVMGGLGETGVEIRVAPHAKFLFLVENFAQLDAPKGTDPVYAIAVSPGIRIWSNNLSADIGVMGGEAYNVKLKRDELPSNKAFVLPMLTLRYQL